MMTTWRCWILIGMWAWACVATSFAAEIDCEHHHCVAVVDAGSTGSRLFGYTYDLDAQGNPIEIQGVYTKKIKPGLANVPNHQTEIDAYLDQLMIDFPAHHVPVYFYATAGMRLLPAERQEQYYLKIKHWFESHPQWPLQDARTISGMEEGVYGWLGINYQLHTLQDERSALVGLLEVGGASTQIAFPVSTVSGIDTHDLQDVTIYGRHIRLFSHSFLSLGVNEVFANAQDRSACFPKGYELKNSESAAGDANVCQQELGDVLQHIYHVDAVTQPALLGNPVQEWYTVSSISSMVSHPPFEFPTPEFSIQSLLDEANTQYCQQSYQTLVAQNPTNDYLKQNCLLAAYFYGLLIHGYGFQPEQSIHYLPKDDATWTLGVLLAEMNLDQ